jgi:hypothetical protein
VSTCPACRLPVRLVCLAPVRDGAVGPGRRDRHGAHRGRAGPPAPWDGAVPRPRRELPARREAVAGAAEDEEGGVIMPATKRPIEPSLIALDDGRLVLQLREGVRRIKQTYYHLERIDSDFGRAFALRKFASCGGDGQVYEVCVEGETDRCCCLGHQAHGHCRHCNAVRELIGRGEL